MAFNQNNPNGINNILGGIIFNTRIISAGSSSTLLDNDYYVQIDISGIYTLNLSSSPKKGRMVRISGGVNNSVVNILTINGNGKNIEGISTKTIITPYGKLNLLYNGTEWLIDSLI